MFAGQKSILCIVLNLLICSFFTQGVSLKQKLVSLDRQTARKTPPVLPHLWDPRCIMGNGSQWDSECRSPRFTSRALPTGPSPQPKVHVSFR